MSSVSVSVHVDEALEVPLDAARIEGIVTFVLEAEGVRNGEIAIALVGDEQISSLHLDYLSREGPTDVISFPLNASDQSLLGDIYVGVAEAERQAEALGVPLAEELLRLAVHGTLHILGYDHPESDEREQSPMYVRQEQLLSAFLHATPSP